jgi:hypothetical protein
MYKKEDSNPHVHLFIPSTHHKVGENETEKYMRRKSSVLATPENLSLADKLSSDLVQAAPPPTQSSPSSPR